MTLSLRRNVGASAYITLDMIKHLADGETVVSATWTPEDTNLMTFVNGSSAPDATGRYISAKFNHLAAGITRVDVLVTTSNPAEAHPVFVLVEQLPPPDVG